PMAVKALKAGAVDFIQKPYREQRLLDSINKALEKDAAARDASAKTVQLDQLLETLTEREREVLDKVLEGRSSKQTARDLGISPRTVEAHRQNLLRKLNFHSVNELVRLLR
ncbi:MAG: LuxR C-terminal-related transcriptional regulator, partial [Arenicellales bacterium]